MTVRSYTRDTRHWQSFPGKGDAFIGSLTTKTQSGVDSTGSELTENPYYMEYNSYNDPVCTYHNKYNPPSYDEEYSVFAAFGPNPLIEEYWTEAELNAHVSQLVAKYKGSDLNLAVSLAEAPSAFRMIEDSALGIYKALKSVKRLDRRALLAQFGPPSGRYGRGLGDFSQARNHGAKMTSLWLEFQYGWLPLLTDVDESLKQLNAFYRKPIKLKYVVRRTKDRSKTNWNPSHDFWLYRRAECTLHRRLALIMTSAPTAASLVGFNNSASVAWEVLPFSFVLDWFVPVSQYLQALGDSRAVTGTWVDTYLTIRRTSGIMPGSIYDRIESGGDSITSITMHRSVSSSPPISMPSIKPLSEVPSWRRVVSALALLNGFNLQL